MTNEQYGCEDKQTLIAYLYGELDQSERKVVDRHLATCAACSAEVTALGDVRSELGLWVPPDVELDFAIVKRSAVAPSNVLRPSRWWNTVPVWAQAAAAILVLAAGAAIANLQIRSGPDGVVVSTGWRQGAVATPPAAAAASDEAWRPALIALEQQLRREIRSSEQQPSLRNVSRAPSDEATIRRVEQMIMEAERRQSREIAVRFVELNRDMNMQRRADLMKISQGFDDYNRQLLGTRQLINNAIRVNATPQQ